MPTFRIVYIEDETFVPRTLTAAFTDRLAAEIEMGKHGHRIVHIAEVRAGERSSDPVTVAIAPASVANAIPAQPDAPERTTATEPAFLGLARFDIASIAVVAASIVAAGAAYLLFGS